MGRQAKRRSTPSAPRPKQTGRPKWLLAALLALVGIALAGALTLLRQPDASSPAQQAPTDLAAGSGPRIAVDQDRFDYGNVKLNTTIETVVNVSNVGDQALALEQNPTVEVVEGC